MARPRKPTAIKKLQGTLQPCRTNFNEPVPKKALNTVEPPDFLSKTARDLWVFALAQAPDELLTTLDFSVFACWADTMAKIIECQEILNREGPTVIDENLGVSKPHPMLKIQNDLKCILKGYLTELGFTPASRSKVSVHTKTENKNPFADL